MAPSTAKRAATAQGDGPPTLISLGSENSAIAQIEPAQDSEPTAAEAALADLCDPVALDDAIATKLARLAVDGEALADLRIAPVCFDGDGFSFARDLNDRDLNMWRCARVAVIVPVRDECGDVFDLVAWNPWTGAIATWRGAAILGEFNLTWRLGEDALRVRPSLLDWLRNERDGIVILDATKAAWWLVDEDLVVDDEAFGRRLFEALTLPRPKIFVRST